MAKIRLVSQMELEGFADTVFLAEESGSDSVALSVDEIKRRSLASRIALEGEPPAYFEQYHRLINARVPWRIAAFVAWSSVPKPHRLPATQEEFAIQVLGLTSDRRIADWRKEFPIDQMIADLQGESLMAWRPGVFEAIGWGASQRDYKAAAQQRLFVELTGDMPNKKLDINTNRASQDLGDLTDAELEALDALSAREMLKKIRDEGKAPNLSDLSDEELDAMDGGND